MDILRSEEFKDTCIIFCTDKIEDIISVKGNNVRKELDKIDVKKLNKDPKKAIEEIMVLLVLNRVEISDKQNKFILFKIGENK